MCLMWNGLLFGIHSSYQSGYYQARARQRSHSNVSRWSQILLGKGKNKKLGRKCKNLIVLYINSIKLLQRRFQPLCILPFKNIAGVVNSLLPIFSSSFITVVLLIYFVVLVFQVCKHGEWIPHEFYIFSSTILYGWTCVLEFRIEQMKNIHRAQVIDEFFFHIHSCLLVNISMMSLPWRLDRVLCSTHFA